MAICGLHKSKEKNSLEQAKKGSIRKLRIRDILGLPSGKVYKFFTPAITLS